MVGACEPPLCCSYEEYSYRCHGIRDTGSKGQVALNQWSQAGFISLVHDALIAMEGLVVGCSGLSDVLEEVWQMGKVCIVPNICHSGDTVAAL